MNFSSCDILFSSQKRKAAAIRCATSEGGGVYVIDGQSARRRHAARVKGESAVGVCR